MWSVRGVAVIRIKYSNTLTHDISDETRISNHNSYEYVVARSGFAGRNSSRCRNFEQKANANLNPKFASIHHRFSNGNLRRLARRADYEHAKKTATGNGCSTGGHDSERSAILDPKNGMQNTLDFSRPNLSGSDLLGTAEGGSREQSTH